MQPLSSPGRSQPSARARFAGLSAALLAASTLSGCATAMDPPSVKLLNVGLVSAGVLDQDTKVVLCVTNPNAKSLRFRRADFTLTVADRPLAQGVSDGALDLPPQSSVPVSFYTHTTTRNLGAQIASTFMAGAVNYEISGSVKLENLPISVPFHSRGQIGLDAVTRQLRPVGADAGVPSGGCAPGDGSL